MSVFIDEIIKDLKENPNTFTDYEGCGVKKNNIKISLYGNTRVLSLINISLNNKDMPTSYIDRWRLEVQIKKWYRNINLECLLKKQ